MLRLIRYLRNYKKESIIGPLFKMLEAFFELLVPLVVADMIDNGIAKGDKTYIYRAAFIMVLLGVVGLICSLVAQFFAAKASVGFAMELRDDLFAHLNRFSYAELDKAGTSTLVTRMTSDMNQVQAGVNLILRLFLRSPFLVVGALVAAFLVNAKVAIVFAIASPILALIIYGIMVLTIPMYSKVQKAVDRISLATREGLNGVRVIRAFGRQKDETEEFAEDSTHLLKLQKRVGKVSAAMNPLTFVVVNLAIAAIIMQGGEQVDAGVITQGEVIALVNYMTQILNALVALQVLIVTATKGMASAKRVNEILDLQPTVLDKEDGVTLADGSKEDGDHAVAVEFSRVSFVYPGAKEEALTGVSFAVKKGQTVGVIGGTGSAKTSLVNLIPRFYDVTKGAVLVNGVDVKDYPQRELRSKIGIVPQKAVLFSGTIRDNMKWGKEDATDEEINEALCIAQAKEFVDAKEGGLDYCLTQGGKNLSGGQRQRLTIARALVRKPEILILDDSSSALDFATDAALRRALSEKTEGMTVFMVSQRTASLQNADMIIVLEDGEVAGIGTHKELVENCEVYREICQSQVSAEEVGA
ncbi:MAG: ABC transporter ATP-binding protein [Lachnospiraceae bacterium]|nr:ABC transporter ATP-binding protein [Lachnospiraceae bacterium]